MAPASDGRRKLTAKRSVPLDFTGWISFLDIFGFSAHLESNFFSNAELKLLQMHNEFSADSIVSGNGSYFMFSDSVVLWHRCGHGDDGSLRNFVDRVARAERIAAGQGFLLRGSAAYGRILLAQNYILGEAYLRAYRFESKELTDPIVVIPEQELENAGVSYLHEFELHRLSLKSKQDATVVKLEYIPWEQIESIRNANIAAIMSSSLSEDQKTKLFERWKNVGRSL